MWQSAICGIFNNPGLRRPTLFQCHNWHRIRISLPETPPLKWNMENNKSANKIDVNVRTTQKIKWLLHSKLFFCYHYVGQWPAPPVIKAFYIHEQLKTEFWISLMFDVSLFVTQGFVTWNRFLDNVGRFT